MKHTTSTYYIEVKEGNTIKCVPHTKGTRNIEFFGRDKAVAFLNELVDNNPESTFRLCKRTVTSTSENWKKKPYVPQTEEDLKLAEYETRHEL